MKRSHKSQFFSSSADRLMHSGHRRRGLNTNVRVGEISRWREKLDVEKSSFSLFLLEETFFKEVEKLFERWESNR